MAGRDADQLRKTLNRRTVKYQYDTKGNITAIESPDGTFRLSTTGEVMQPGPAGPQGPQGDAGPAGATGAAGAAGRDGTNGVDGGAGSTGVRGATGPAGASGSKGEQGDTGPIGPTGAQGPIGPAGPAGAMGPRGDSGTPGATGPKGATGDTGPAGARGAAGVDAKRIDTYIGTTDANGLYTVTYTAPFATVPSVQPEPPLLGSQVWTKVSSTTTGFSLRLVQRNSAQLLGLELLLAAMVNVAGAPARVVVIAA